jgi:hypothetical protein
MGLVGVATFIDLPLLSVLLKTAVKIVPILTAVNQKQMMFLIFCAFRLWPCKPP